MKVRETHEKETKAQTLVKWKSLANNGVFKIHDNAINKNETDEMSGGKIMTDDWKTVQVHFSSDQGFTMSNRTYTRGGRKLSSLNVLIKQR